MSTPDPHNENLAELYVLDLLEPDQRVAFEATLKADASLRAHVRFLREGLARWAVSPVGQEDAPEPRAAVWDRIQGDIRRGPAPALPARPGRRIVWAWPIAAAVLLGLNLYQLSLRDDNRLPEAPTLAAARSPDPTTPGTPASRGKEAIAGAAATDVTPSTDGVAPGQTPTPGSSSRQPEVSVRELIAQRDTARAERDAALEANRAWETNYQALVARMAPLVASADVARFTVFQINDAAALARGERPVDIVDLFREQTRQQLQTLNLAVLGDNGGAAPSASSAAPSFGVALWDEAAGMGYLNVYNLARPPLGSTYRLYAADAEGGYQTIGEIPADKAGEVVPVVFQSTHADFVPLGIVITEEPVGSSGQQPSGRVVLQGGVEYPLTEGRRHDPRW